MKLFRCVLASICLWIQDSLRPPFQPQQVKLNGGDSDEQQPNKARKESEQSSLSPSAVKRAISDEAKAAVKVKEGISPPTLTSKCLSFF
jgi:hypothetical protein